MRIKILNQLKSVEKNRIIFNTIEELSINFDNFEYQELGRLSPQKNMVSANMRVYEINMETTPNYNKNDSIESYWLTPKAVLNKISNGDKSKGDLPILINYFYGNKKPSA